ncbi:MAG TPA: hypothetical protein DF712_08545 [Balneola sp.]|nr:hypothetical protein [Balneola sp.]
MKFIPKILVIFGFLLLGCTSNDAQREFEIDAYQDPAGITSTSAQGEVTSEDPDDWRASPFFQGLIEVKPAYPNPIELGGVIEFEYFVLSTQPVNGLQVVTRGVNGQLSNYIYTSSSNPLPNGIDNFRIDPKSLSPDGSDALARGLHRVFFFDLNQRLISYGDIRVE